MKVLHTSDWHVGRTLARGRSREAEHREVLAEIAAVISAENVDLILVAGDIFDHPAPTAAAEQIVYEALLAMTAAGADVVMVAGNHDNPHRLDAVRPLLNLAHVHTGALLQRPEDGGCIDLTLRTGELARIALVPWLSQRGIVRADELMQMEQADHQGQYAERCRRILEQLTAGFDGSAVNLVLGHLTITGAEVGGGERRSETIFDYWVPAQSLPSKAHYIALGHIHRAQKLPVQWPTWYSGSPLQLDFGERPEGQCVLVFEALPGLPVGEVRRVELKAGRKLITVRGSFEALRERAATGEDVDAYLRVFVDEPARAGLAEEIRELLPNALEVHIEPAPAPDSEVSISRVGAAPRDLLTAYLESANATDERVVKLFDELMEDEHATAAS